MNLKALFPDCRTEIIIILLQISGQGGINLSMGKRRFTEERNLTKENKEESKGHKYTKEHQTFV